MRNTLLLTAMAVTAISLSACKEKSTTSVVDANGTKTEATVTSDVNNHSDGRQTGTVDTKTTIDPPGMMNKETVEKTHQEAK